MSVFRRVWRLFCIYDHILYFVPLWTRSLLRSLLFLETGNNAWYEQSVRLSQGSCERDLEPDLFEYLLQLSTSDQVGQAYEVFGERAIVLHEFTD